MKSLMSRLLKQPNIETTKIEVVGVDIKKFKHGHILLLAYEKGRIIEEDLSMLQNHLIQVHGIEVQPLACYGDPRTAIKFYALPEKPAPVMNIGILPIKPRGE